MSIETVKEMVEWLKDFRNDSIEFLFHGGEPLLAGASFYRQALPLISDGLSHLQISFALQTNLWMLTPELAEILANYHVSIGSSLDGPQDLNDFQRSKGYYERTMKGYEIAKAHGFKVGFISVFTPYTLKHKDEIFNYFKDNCLSFKAHPAMSSMRDGESDRWAIAPEEYGELLVYLLDRYLDNWKKVEVSSIDDFCRCFFRGRGAVCIFVDCIDDFFAVGPDGSIYPCYRHVGMPKYVMGNIRDRPKLEDLARSDAWKFMQKFKEYVNEACKSCTHVEYCRGGCPYNAPIKTDGEVKGIDPYCVAYKRIFDEISDRFNKEMIELLGLQRTIGTGVSQTAFMKEAKPGVISIMHKISLDK